jgi:hypothetical protein
VGRRWFIAGLVVAAAVQGLPLAPVRAAEDPVLIGAGDIASCGSSGDTRTAELIARTGGIPFTVGDNAYSSGTAAEYANCYVPSGAGSRLRPDPSSATTST